MVAERFFAKDRPNFMSAYVKETERSYGYLLIDNQFLDCVRYNEDFVKSRFVITEVLFDTFYSNYGRAGENFVNNRGCRGGGVHLKEIVPYLSA